MNVIPREFRRRQLPLLTAGLALVLVGALLLLYGIFYLKTYADLEITAFHARIAPAQEAVRAATVGEEAANQERQRYAGQQADYQILAERQVVWSKVLQAVGAPPPGIVVKEISQAGYTVSVLGSAPEFSQAVRFLEALRATDLFSNSSIELIDSSTLAVGSPTPRASFGTPTATRPAGIVPIGTPTIPLATRTPTATPTASSTPNLTATAVALANSRATSTAAAKLTATAAAMTQTAVAKTQTSVAKTQTAASRPPATATKTRTPTPPATATAIVTMILDIAPSEVSEVGGSTSLTGFGPAQAVDGLGTTAWVPYHQTGNSGRWIRVDLRNSIWYTPGTDVMWSVKIVPYRYLVPGTPPLPPTSTGTYYVYAYDQTGTRTLLCSRLVSWTQLDTCFSAATKSNVPLSNVAVLDIGIPSSNPTTDANWLQGIAEITIEVNARPPAVAAVPVSGPLGLGPESDLGTPTATAPTAPPPLEALPTATPTPTPPSMPPPAPSRLIAGQSPTPTVSPTAQGPADFLILLEVKPGEGYR